MFIDFLLEQFARHGDSPAIIWRSAPYSYGQLANATRQWLDRMAGDGIVPGTVVALEADFSPNAIALLLALIERGCVVVPLTESVNANKSSFRATVEAEAVIQIGFDDRPAIRSTGAKCEHPLIRHLKLNGHPGLVLFSSGSTGKHKAALHDFVPLLEKFHTPRPTRRMLTFLLFDHIGGINTLFHNLSNAGCVVTVEERSPDAVCALIEKFGVEVLPTSPTFLNLLLVSRAFERYDLSSLQLVTYGTEVMPESTLRHFRMCFPALTLQQTYGLSEVGILRSKSRSSDSLWVKIGGEGFTTRVVDGMLEINARSSMLGYLNAPSPFTDDGWFKTGDAVDVDGEYIRILGRKSEIINIGGEKVFPVEVESMIQSMDGVDDVAVVGEPSALTGQMLVARVKLNSGETLPEFRKRLRIFCKGQVANYKIPQKIIVVDHALHGGRFKKTRGEYLCESPIASSRWGEQKDEI